MDEADREALRAYGIAFDTDGELIPTAEALAAAEAASPTATEAEKLRDARVRTMVAADVQIDLNGKPLFPAPEELVDGQPLGSWAGSGKPKTSN